MPSPPRASVSYKKKDGTLAVSGDQKYLFWTPTSPPDASPVVTVPIADITNLQQTPESSPKVALKVFVKDDSYVFSFTRDRSEARKEQEALTDTLRNVLAAAKAGTAQLLAAGGGGIASGGATPAQQNGRDAVNEGQSAAMAMAKAVSSKAKDDEWYDDAKLKADIQLQKSLLESNTALRERFNQSFSDKPESVSATQFTSQFWGARLHLLRAHAIEKAQKQGEYNVLPEIKFVRIPGKDGEPDTRRLNLTKDQIMLIFKQYPVVKEAYDESCPPMDQGMFWQRFFNSRLLKKLKGEKITQQDPPDAALDKYMDRKEAGPAAIGYVPHFIDLEGNEQNHSQRKGNRPDETMRPSETSKVPVLRILNNLSEKMMAHVAPEDGEAHAPIGLDEGTFEQLRLRDLAREDEDNRVVLNVREQKRFLSGDEDDESRDAKRYRQQDPKKVLKGLKNDLIPAHFGADEKGCLRLDKIVGLGVAEDDDEDEDDNTAGKQTNGVKPPIVGSSTAMKGATSSILASVKQRRSLTTDDASSLHGLSQDTFATLAMTHNTTNEFLHYFWTLYLSGDPSKAPELQGLITTLDRSLDRINTVAGTAEEERKKRVDSIKNQIQEYYQKTGKKRKFDFDSIEGGKVVVEGMIRPTINALVQATSAYRKAFEEQSAAATAAGGGP